ncbi:hypothetical protein Ciccas_006665 [Cichlidogyrus casuarinus]|uniref:Ion transport domain-containing protein n=1 Tax=Cichlidogyrus casuarinus TaxID=1844966 RepID=A0ABD2Q5P9_9PLAT
MTYTAHRNTKETLQLLDKVELDAEDFMHENLYKQFGLEQEYSCNDMTLWQRFRPKIWAMLEVQGSSFSARVSPFISNQYSSFANYTQSSSLLEIFGIVSMIVIIVSILAYCCETIPNFHQPQLKFETNNLTDTPWVYKVAKAEVPNWFMCCEAVCNLWFTLELLIRFTVCVDHAAFLLNPINLIDIMALFSFYIDYIRGAMKLLYRMPDSLIKLLEFFSILRVMRILKLTRHFSGLKILILTFKASAKEFSLLVFFLAVFIVVFAALIYYAERSQVPFTHFDSSDRFVQISWSSESGVLKPQVSTRTPNETRIFGRTCRQKLRPNGPKTRPCSGCHGNYQTFNSFSMGFA